MRITRLTASSRALPPAPSALAIGNFDGLHIGHRAVIEAMKQQADRQGLVPSVLTFWPHPRAVFAKNSPAFALQSFAQKAASLRALGVQQLWVLRFDAATIALSADAFMQRILADFCHARYVVTGDNFAFGHKRAGTTATLAAHGPAHGFTAQALPHVLHGGSVCSSSAIRAALTAGDVAQANAMLGRPYTLLGTVVHGDGRGASIGFPTANIGHDAQLLLPQNGVYAVRLRHGDAWVDAVANLGTRPTFAGEGRRLEVHVLDGAHALYGARVAVEFLAHLRGEQKFDGVDALRAQIHADCAAARIALLRAA